MAPQIGNYLFYGFGYLHDKLVLETTIHRRYYLPRTNDTAAKNARHILVASVRQFERIC
jgi:hypothetical protein